MSDKRFVIREEIGRGGHGIVYRAQDEQLDRIVAVKVFHDPQMGTSRLLREARTLCRLSHDGIIQVYDVSQILVSERTLTTVPLSDDGSAPPEELAWAMIMEDLGDMDPLHYVRRHGDREAFRIVAEIAEAMKIVHAAGIFHCDLSNNNVRVVRGKAKVFDFSLAARVPGRPYGTPAYRAPEQARGEDPCDRTDVYALGLLLDALLDSSENGTWAEPLVKRMLDADPTKRPSMDEVAEFCRSAVAAAGMTPTGEHYAPGLPAWKVDSTPAAGALSSPNTARSREVFSDGAPLHWVDREKQTEHLKELCTIRQHHIALIPGAQGEAHELFLARLEKVLPHHPPRRTIWVHWPRRHTERLPPFPTTQSELLGALAQALGGRTAQELPSLLAMNLSHQDLLLLHPVVERGFSEESLLLYYTRWLPDHLAPLPFQFRCKLLQPVSWSPAAGLIARAIGRARPTRQDAYAFMHQVESASAPILPIEKLSELQKINRSDILDFLRKCRYAEHLPPARRERACEELSDKVLARVVTSEEILHALSAELPELS